MASAAVARSSPMKGVERKLMSDFVRKRIEALNRSNVESSLGDISGCYDCADGSGTIVSATDGNRDTVAVHELIHKGCPICTACFAGFNPNEQVPETGGGHADCPFCDVCLKNSIKKIRRRSFRILRGLAPTDSDVGHNTHSGAVPKSFVLEGEGETFDALIDQLEIIQQSQGKKLDQNPSTPTSTTAFSVLEGECFPITVHKSDKINTDSNINKNINYNLMTNDDTVEKNTGNSFDQLENNFIHEMMEKKTFSIDKNNSNDSNESEHRITAQSTGECAPSQHNSRSNSNDQIFADDVHGRKLSLEARKIALRKRMSLRSSSGGEKSIEKENNDSENGTQETNRLQNGSQNVMMTNAKNVGANIVINDITDFNVVDQKEREMEREKERQNLRRMRELREVNELSIIEAKKCLAIQKEMKENKKKDLLSEERVVDKAENVDLNEKKLEIDDGLCFEVETDSKVEEGKDKQNIRGDAKEKERDRNKSDDNDNNDDDDNSNNDNEDENHDNDNIDYHEMSQTDMDNAQYFQTDDLYSVRSDFEVYRGNGVYEIFSNGKKEETINMNGISDLYSIHSVETRSSDQSNTNSIQRALQSVNIHNDLRNRKFMSSPMRIPSPFSTNATPSLSVTPRSNCNSNSTPPVAPPRVPKEFKNADINNRNNKNTIDNINSDVNSAHSIPHSSKNNSNNTNADRKPQNNIEKLDVGSNYTTRRYSYKSDSNDDSNIDNENSGRYYYSSNHANDNTGTRRHSYKSDESNIDNENSGRYYYSSNHANDNTGTRRHSYKYNDDEINNHGHRYRNNNHINADNDDCDNDQHYHNNRNNDGTRRSSYSSSTNGSNIENYNDSNIRSNNGNNGNNSTRRQVYMYEKDIYNNNDRRSKYDNRLSESNLYENSISRRRESYQSNNERNPYNSKNDVNDSNNNDKYYNSSNHHRSNQHERNDSNRGDNNNNAIRRNSNPKKFVDDDASHYDNVLQSRKVKANKLNDPNSSFQLVRKQNDGSKFRARRNHENITFNDNQSEKSNSSENSKIYYSTPARQSQYARALAAVFTPNTSQGSWTLGFKTVPKRKKPLS